MGCTGNAFAAARIREMDERALARLYADTQAYVASKPSMTSWNVVRGDDLPSTLSGLHAKYASIEGDDMLFVLSGCFDDKVYLHVDRDAEDGSGEIVLSPGEARANETLWRSRPVTAPVSRADADPSSVEAPP
jgi:hypothetical protein